MGVSFLIHLLLIALASHLLHVGSPGPDAGRTADTTEPEPQGIRVVRLAEGAEPLDRVEDPPVERPQETRVTTPVPTRPGQPGAAPADAPVTTDVPRAADRLHTPMRDGRLWVLPRDLPAPLKSDEELMLERVYGKLERLNDSIMAEIEAGRRAMDWTVQGEDGKRWGVSPEGIHLGGITLPVPMLGPPAGRRDEANERAREWTEIQSQADRARVRDRFDERAKAMRERRDREREEQRRPPPPPPPP